MAYFNIAPVPAARRGRPGTHPQMTHAPMAVLNGSAQTPNTSAQYPQPAQANRIDTTTDTALATMSFFATAEKSIARFNRATCMTETLVTKIDTETPTAMDATNASP